MKSAVAAIGIFAVAVNAWSHPRHLADNWAHPRHFHYARDNTTTTAAGQTTLTVIATQTHTITSCAPTVTNCPADQTGISALPETDKTTFVVTDTVQLTTTVCPVSDAASISASVISDLSSGLITGSPITTAPPSETTASGADAITGDDNTTTDIVVEKTLTITLGSGTAATVVTSTIASTLSGEDTDALTTGDLTTTTTATKTLTHTVTVSEADETATVTGKAGGDDAECVATTVTVTEAASTVYVTVGGETASQTVDAEEPTSTDEGEDDGGDDDDEDDEDDEDECPAESTTTSQTTVTVAPTLAPYPTGNGTVTSGVALPTGLSRRFRFQ